MAVRRGTPPAGPTEDGNGRPATPPEEDGEAVRGPAAMKPPTL